MWAFLGSRLSTAIDRWHNRPRRIRVLVYGNPGYGAVRFVRGPFVEITDKDGEAMIEGLQRGLWLENNDDE
jgi:hypothetical protein